MKPDPSRGLLAAAVVVVGTVALSAQPQWQDVIRNLRHPEAATRLDAVERLGRGNYVAAVESIAPLIRDPDDRVQAAALEAELTFFLAGRVSDRRGSSRAQQAFEAGPFLRTAAEAPPALVDALIAAIRDENARVRFDAVHALGFIAEPPLDSARIRALAEELDHYDPVIRAATARVLGRFRQREAGERLLAALDDSSETVRQFAVESIGLVREDRAVTKLRDLVARANGRNTVGLVAALARIAAPDDLAMFRQLLSDREAGRRRAGAEGIGRVGDALSVEALERLLATDRDASVRLAAAFALQRLGRTQSHVIASRLAEDDEYAQARDYLLELGRDAVPGLHQALKVATNPRHRADLVQAIGYVGSSDDLPVIQALLTDREERVQRAATAAVLRLKRAG